MKLDDHDEGLPDAKWRNLIVASENYYRGMEEARALGYPKDLLGKCIKSLESAALAYSRPIVCEECAEIVDGLTVPDARGREVIRDAAAAIREHGKKA